MCCEFKSLYSFGLMMERDFIIGSPWILMGPKEDWKAMLILFSGITQQFYTGAKLGNKREKVLLQEKAACIELCMPLTIT
jgi:hypothetical protein